MDENKKDTVKRYSFPSPKTVKERMDWLRKNIQEFRDEEKIVKEVKDSLKKK
jgi:hypothetical protein